MDTPSAEKLRSAWTRQAAMVARKINLAWWIETLSVPLVTIGLVGACVLLLVRREVPDAQPWALWSGAGGAVALLAGITWLVARRRFEMPEQSMVRIEASMRMRNALSAARAGVAPWPELPPRVDAGVDWAWQRVLVPPIAAITFLAAGLLIPVHARTTRVQDHPDQPQAWTNLETDLERLAQEDVIDETYIEEMKKKVEELRDQKEEDWFSHSSLEATDTLKKEHASQVEQMQRELGRAEKAMGNLEKMAAGMSPQEKDKLLNQFDQALKGLQNGALKPNSKLMDQLKGLDPKDLGQMNPEQLQQLKDSMKKAAQACKDCQGGEKGDGPPGPGEGKGQGAGDEWNDELNDGQGNGQGDKEGQGKEGNGSGDGEGDQNGPDGDGPGGKGGVNRGPGHSPGVLGKEKDKVDIGKLTGIESKDLSRALPGDLLQLQDGEYDVDKSAVGPRAGGAAGATGAGGDRVWKDSLDPAEQKALKKFFE
ncbi:hypothetical protein [Haloferula sp. BvORR071]|uniref:hypothetical protein n=1 Tax=Haloferula sp. BvORR071 TaxID=1396141 RepID=UPI000556C4C3|nr:hypothetical protein [Haloferula sp. BvORR071]